MQFTFKRDEEGHERIYVGDVCVAQNAVGVTAWESVYVADGVERKALDAAIERADEAGFWHYGDHGGGYNHDEVTVDVPVPETSTTLVVVQEGDE